MSDCSWLCDSLKLSESLPLFDNLRVLSFFFYVFAVICSFCFVFSFFRKNKEMLEYMAPLVGNPGEYWNYRDESWVGFWASASHQRGGANRVATLVLNFLNRYRALEGI